MSSSQSTNSVAQSGVTNSAHRKRSRAGNRAKRVLDPNYVPRPPNAFILFRTDWIKKNNSLLNGTQKKHLSKVVGSLWRSLSKEEKLPWEKLAETCKAIHREQHPNYKFKPIRDKEKEKEKKKIKKKPSKKFSSVATVPENRNSTSPLPLSPEAIIPLDHEKAFIPEDYVLVSTPESPHHTPPQHGGHCDLSTPQLQSTPNPGGSSNHSSATQYGPLASKFSSTWGHSFRTVESHSPHQSTPAVLGHSLQYHTEGSSRSPSNNGGYSLSANQEEHRTFFHSNSDPGLPISSVHFLRVQPDPLGQQVAHKPHTDESHTQGLDSYPVLPFVPPESELSRDRRIDATHRHHADHVGFTAPESLPSQHLKHMPEFSTNVNRDFRRPAPFEESFPSNSDIPLPHGHVDFSLYNDEYIHGLESFPSQNEAATFFS